MNGKRLPPDELIHVGPDMARAILKFNGLKPRFKKEVTSQAARVLLAQDRVMNPKPDQVDEPPGSVGHLIEESDLLLRGLNFSGHIRVVVKPPLDDGGPTEEDLTNPGLSALDEPAGRFDLTAQDVQDAINAEADPV